MKISQHTDSSASLSGAVASATAKNNGPAASAVAKSTATSNAQSPGVAVTVSTLARSFKASAGSGDDPDIDTAKVSAVKTAISNGTFRPNAGAIADKLLAAGEEMLGRG